MKQNIRFHGYRITRSQQAYLRRKLGELRDHLREPKAIDFLAKTGISEIVVWRPEDVRTQEHDARQSDIVIAKERAATAKRRNVIRRCLRILRSALCNPTRFEQLVGRCAVRSFILPDPDFHIGADAAPLEVVVSNHVGTGKQPGQAYVLYRTPGKKARLRNNVPRD